MWTVLLRKSVIFFFFSNAWRARQQKNRRIQSQSSSVKSQQTDRAFKWELQFLANDKSCITQWIAQKNIQYQLLCHLKCPFSWEKKSIITSMLCYYSNKPSVRNQWKLLKCIRPYEDDGVTSRCCHFSRCGDEWVQGFHPPSTEKKIKWLKCHSTQHRVVQPCISQGSLLQGSLVQRFGRNQRKKNIPTTGGICSEFSFSAGCEKWN